MVPMKDAKVRDVAKMLDVIPLQFRGLFDAIVQGFSNGAEENDAVNESGSEVWDSDDNDDA